MEEEKGQRKFMDDLLALEDEEETFLKIRIMRCMLTTCTEHGALTIICCKRWIMTVSQAGLSLMWGDGN